MKEVPMDTSFRVLQKKEIYEFLEGNGDQELVTYDNQSMVFLIIRQRNWILFVIVLG